MRSQATKRQGGGCKYLFLSENEPFGGRATSTLRFSPEKHTHAQIFLYVFRMFKNPLKPVAVHGHPGEQHLQWVS